MNMPQEPVRPARSGGVGSGGGGRQRRASDGGHCAVDDDRASRMSERVQSLRIEKQPVNSGRRRRRWWLLLLPLVVVGVGGPYAYHSHALRGLSGPIEVESIKVTFEQPADVVLDTTGSLVSPITTQVMSQVSGTVVEMNIEVGKKVKKDELLLRIDAQQYAAELAQAKATLAAAEARLAEALAGSREEDVRQAEAALDQAKARRDGLAGELERAKTLKDVISKAEYDQVEANHREAEANVERLSQALKLVKLGPRQEQVAALKADVKRAEALVAEAQCVFDRTQIRSPIDGTVLKRSVELGEIILVQPGIFATSVATIADLSRLEAEIEIQERDLAAVETGQVCLVTPDAYPDRQYRGRLDRLAPELSRERGSRQAQIVLADPDGRLAPNMNCRVQVLKEDPSNNQPDVARVPKEAVFTDNERAYLFVFREGKVHRQDVRLGKAAGGKVEVLSGLSDAEEVLLPGDGILKEGQPVRTRLRGNATRG